MLILFEFWYYSSISKYNNFKVFGKVKEDAKERLDYWFTCILLVIASKQIEKYTP